ncbi:MAG: hypothetical protein AMXMBFR4_24870 [Candidatus Hydrogenedentota bacterium]
MTKSNPVPLRRVRIIVFTAIAAAIALRFASLLLAQSHTGGLIMSGALGIAGLVLLGGATVYALRKLDRLPRYFWAVLLAMACLAVAQAMDLGRPLSLSLDADRDPAGLTAHGVVGTLLLCAGLGLALVGFYQSVFEVLDSRTRLDQEQQQLHDALIERQAAEKKLRESEERLRVIFEGMEDAVFVHDLQGRILECNDAACERLGYSRAELLAMRTVDLDTPEFAAGFRDRLHEQLSHRRFRCEGEHVTKDGRRIPVDIHTTLIDFHGYAAILAVIRDITARKAAEREREELQAKVLHAQKLESLGALAGGIAHDFNNLLMGVMGNSSLALQELPPDAPAVEYIRQIEIAAQRAAELSRQMLAYSGRGAFTLQRIDLTSLVREMEHLVGLSVHKDVSIECRLAPDLPAVLGDPGQIKQIIMNLVTNAADAIGNEPGRITIETGTEIVTDDSHRDDHFSDQLGPGRYAYVEVADTGCGMEESTIRRVFDPFFSTKFPGRGLGLAAALGVVQGHRGAIRVRSQLGEGSSFRVYFPERSPESVEAPAETPAENLWESKGAVLVVDDEELVRNVTRRALERVGFTVLLANDGAEAIEIFRRNCRDIVMVLLDMTMPRLNGEETYIAIREVRDDVQVVVTSGYAEAEMRERFTGVAAFIQKPYRAGELIALVRNVLSAVPASPA